jgi:Uma2 family endonuclease
MGMVEAVRRRWTRAEVLALPDDGNRYELFDGELLVTPAPAHLHQRVISCLLTRLIPYVDAMGVGRVYTSPADLALGGDQLSQPDIFVVPSPPGGRASWNEVPNPVLVIEVLSPGTARHDRTVKRRRFQRAGIPEYWIIDPEARLVERWRPGDERPEILDERLEWQPSPGEPLRIDLPALFVEVFGD